MEITVNRNKCPANGRARGSRLSVRWNLSLSLESIQDLLTAGIAEPGEYRSLGMDTKPAIDPADFGGVRGGGVIEPSILHCDCDWRRFGGFSKRMKSLCFRRYDGLHRKRILTIPMLSYRRWTIIITFQYLRADWYVSFVWVLRANLKPAVYEALKAKTPLWFRYRLELWTDNLRPCFQNLPEFSTKSAAADSSTCRTPQTRALPSAKLYSELGRDPVMTANIVKLSIGNTCAAREQPNPAQRFI